MDGLQHRLKNGVIIVRQTFRCQNILFKLLIKKFQISLTMLIYGFENSSWEKRIDQIKQNSVNIKWLV